MVSVEAGVVGIPAHRPEDLMSTLPRIAVPIAVTLVSLALVPAVVVSGSPGDDQSAQTHVRKA